MTTTTTADLGDRRWALLDGCYISNDGVEIRDLPGWKCVYDFVGTGTRNLTSTALDGTQPGFLRTMIDGWNPVYTTLSDYLTSVTDPTYKQLVYTTAESLHGFRRIKGRLVMWGEMGFRREPIKNAAGSAFVTIASWATGTNTITFNTAPLNNGEMGEISAIGGGPVVFTVTAVGVNWTVNQWAGYGFALGGSDLKLGAVTSNTANVLTVNTAGFNGLDLIGDVGKDFTVFSGTPANGSNAPFNSIRVGSIIWIGDIPASNAGGTSLANKAHRVIKLDGAVATLSTTISASATASTPIEVARIAPGRASTSDYPIGKFTTLPQFSADVTGVGAWVSTQYPDLESLRTECFALNVFNRQRDYGDTPFAGREHIEGISGFFEIDPFNRMQASRRRQRSVPFRLNPDTASDRLLLAAPGYGCVFQVPMVGAVNPTYGSTDTALGITGLWANSLLDKPRALGVPKGVLWADEMRTSDQPSQHFYATTNLDYCWGGFKTWTRNKLRSYSGDIDSYVEGGGSVQTVVIETTDLPSANFFGSTGTGAVVDGEATLTSSTIRSGRGLLGIDDHIDVLGDGFFSGHGHVFSSAAAVAGPPNTVSLTLNTNTLPPPRFMHTGSFASSITATPDDYDLQKSTLAVSKQNNTVRWTFSPLLAADQMVAGAEVGNLVRIVEPLNPTGSTSPTFGYRDPNYTYLTVIDNGVDWVETPWFSHVVYNDGYKLPTVANPFVFPPRASLALPDERFGTYKFRVAYRDTATGEIGLLSEPLELEIKADFSRYTQGVGVRLFIAHPGYLMAESGALQVELYRTQRNQDTYYFDSIVPMSGMGSTMASTTLTSRRGSVFGIVSSPDHTGAIQFAAYDVPYKTDEELEQFGSRYVPTIENMPVGCVTAKTVKGITLFGGHVGESGDALDMVRGAITIGLGDGQSKNQAHQEPDQITVVGGGSGKDISTGLSDGPWLCAQEYVPSGYCGIGAQFFVPPETFGGNGSYQLLSVDLTHGQTSAAEMQRQKLSVGNSRLLVGSELTEQTRKPAWLKIPSGIYNWSVLAQPGVVPAINIGFIDSDANEDIQAIGAWNGGAILCTRSNTYYQSWTDEPRATPDVVSNEFGCIATNSMVEFDGGTAWISDRGPVAMTADGVDWIGRDVEGYFTGPSPRYLRDSRGLMRHAWSCHDPERGLVYWGLYTEANGNPLTVTYGGTDTTPTTYAWTSAPDQIMSRWPCNEILVWSYRSRSFSRWRTPQGMGWLWMERDTDRSGRRIVEFLGTDKRIYALDDLYADSNKDPLVLSLTAAGSGLTLARTTSTSEWGVDQSALGAGEKYVRVGMQAAVIRSGVTVYVGTVTAASASSLTVTLEPGRAGATPSWLAGDQLWIGVRRITMESNWLAPKGTEEPTSLLATQVRYSLVGRNTRGDGALSVGKAIKVTTYSTKAPTGIDSQAITSVVHTTDRTEAGEWFPIGLSGTSNYVQKLTTKATGQTVKVKLEMVGAAQARISDVLLEV